MHLFSNKLEESTPVSYLLNKLIEAPVSWYCCSIALSIFVLKGMQLGDHRLENQWSSILARVKFKALWCIAPLIVSISTIVLERMHKQQQTLLTLGLVFYFITRSIVSHLFPKRSILNTWASSCNQINCIGCYWSTPKDSRISFLAR